jgi:hypothetical protein
MGFSKYVYHNGLNYYPPLKKQDKSKDLVSKEEALGEGKESGDL